MNVEQWTIVVDAVPYADGRIEWEAHLSSDQEDEMHWASNDVHTLMAAVGRDLADLMRDEEPRKFPSYLADEYAKPVTRHHDYSMPHDMRYPDTMDTRGCPPGCPAAS